ncbi:MAG: RluA family pseudouridine synthase [Fibromonadaceae bacterium]|jgi:23S rRNA pseudouridine1911/1915/1917 synthase|nr:RluA family pseudouridine synthase [Fibromonadaceae bacterium]
MMRLDKYLQSKYPEYSRTDLQKIIAEGKVLLNGKALPKNFRVTGDVEPEILQMPVKAESFLEPENIPLNIVFEDEHLAVLNKPRNMVIHPGSGISKGTLAAALLWHFKNLSQINGPLRPGILHRLDKDTPGLLVVAKTDLAHRELSRQLEERTLERTYRAVIWGILRDREGKIDAPVERDSKNRLKMAVQTSGKAAVTYYKTLETFGIASLAEFQLETGRTHQIRVHLRYLGNPVAGDPLYDGREESAKRIDPIYRDITEKLLEIAPAQLLQSYKIKFKHPKTKKTMEFEIPPDEPLNKALHLLQKECEKNNSPMQLFEPPQIYANPEDIELPPEEAEEEPVKTRPTRAERYAATKIKRALKKERDTLRLKEKARKEAEMTLCFN